MKIALCFIISYKHVLNKEALWREWIEPNKDIINIYFHYKDIKFIKSRWILNHTIPPKYIQATSYYDVVPAYISLMTFAFYHDPENKWYCMLTDSCVPIISPENFRKLFNAHYQKSIIHCKPAYWNIDIHKRANLRYLSKQYHLANDPWFTFTRQHVHNCILFLSFKNKLFRTINAGGLANESIFAIILETFNELTKPQHIINQSSSICDWTRMSNPTSPYLFRVSSDENNNIIANLLKENHYAMFLRKVSSEYPDKCLKELWYRKEIDKDIFIIDRVQLRKQKIGQFMFLFLFIGIIYSARMIAKFVLNPDFFRKIMQ